MKVTIEGIPQELFDMAELLGYGRSTCRAAEVPKNRNTASRDVRAFQAGDDVPNRFREEGVQ